MNVAETFYTDCSLALISLLFSTEAAVLIRSSKQVFLKFSRISEENTCVGISFWPSDL